MNYLHAYHAGNHADVFKHIVLIQLLQHLLKKAQPFCYIDTHAGQPVYTLEQKEAQATGEFRIGIAKLWDGLTLPAEIGAYLALIKAANPDPDRLTHYIGSAGIAQRLLRTTDRAILCDTQPAVYQQLRAHFRHHPNIHVHQRDGYQALTACLPPKEKRGVVLIDPPYEASDDWHKLTVTVQQAIRRWPHGSYAIWFPIKDPQLVKQLLQRFVQTGIPNILLSEFCPWPTDIPHSMNGSAMLLINPPWQLDIGLNRFLPALLEALQQHPRGYTRTYWLTEPR